MKKLFIILSFFFTFALNAQNAIKVVVTDSTTNEPIIGVAVQIEGTSLGNVTDTEGVAEINNPPKGKHNLVVSFVGYRKFVLPLEFPLSDAAILKIKLASEVEDLEVVTVSASRTNSRIEDIATKVEVLGAEDVEEENSIKPANIGSLLGDLSIIHIQQNSAVSGASSVRMQGLDGKYTQILRDGLPLYEGFSGSFGILQIPPLDLKQIEIIKGSNSTLYGGGAIGGLINLVSKEPTAETDVSLTLNQSTLRETNVNGFYAKRFDKLGLTMFAGHTVQKAVDVNGDGFSDVPEVSGTFIHPRIFYYFNPTTILKVGVNSLFENRIGGDISVIDFKADSLHAFYEKNKSARNSLDFQFNTDLNNNKVSAKGVFSVFDRAVEQSGFLFQGQQTSSFVEVSDFIKLKNNDLVFGVNWTDDKFEKKASDPTAIANYENQTTGAFIQNGWQINPKWLIEAGIRGDFLTRNVGNSEFFVLPRIAILLKAMPDLTFRLSAGTGYKVPNIFTQETVAGSFRDLRPLSINVKSEQSTSLNGDINFHALLKGDIGLYLNQAFYVTRITNAVIAKGNGFVNATYAVQSLGSDTYVRLKKGHVELYLGFNHTISDGDNKPILFAPRDKFSMTFSYDIEGEWRFGLENSWVGNQYISETAKAPDFWFFAGMIERKFSKNVSVVLNAENLLDERQSRRETLFTGSPQRPDFKALYMPIDGRVVNLALRIKLWFSVIYALKMAWYWGGI